RYRQRRSPGRVGAARGGDPAPARTHGAHRAAPQPHGARRWSRLGVPVRARRAGAGRARRRGHRDEWRPRPRARPGPARGTPARGTGVPIWTDLHDYDGVAEFHAPFLAAADYVFCNADRLADPLELLRSVVAHGAKVAVCTLGADGAVAVDADGELRVAAEPV